MPLIAFCVLAFARPAVAEVTLLPDSTGHVVSPTLVNDQGPFEFIVDTGADETAIFAWLGTQLGLPAQGETTVDGATGAAAAEVARISRLSLDGYAIEQVKAVTLPTRADGLALGGIVGVDVMVGRLAVLDFGCGTLALLPTGSPKDVLGALPRLVKAGSIPGGKQLTLPVKVNGVTGVGVLDSGARSTLVNRAFAAAAGLDIASDEFRDGEPARGATRTAVRSRVGPVGAVEFAGVKRVNVTARVLDLPAFEGSPLTKKPLMVLGLDLLQGLRLSVDVSARRLWIAESRCVPARPRALQPGHVK